MSAETETQQETALHGGRLVAKRLKAHGVTKLFTLSGGHLFSIYDGCREEGIDIVDVRHEQSAAFAAEGWAKATREPGVCALTAGPGVTNGMSGLASRADERLAGPRARRRAPAARWGMGSLQEIDHVPFVEPLTKLARTADSTADIPALVDEALRAAVEPPSGPTFLDFPLDQVFMEASVDADAPGSLPEPSELPAADGDALDRAVELLRGAEKPVVMAGNGPVLGARREGAAALSEELQIPVFLNGLARGCVPADDPHVLLARARRRAEGSRRGARGGRPDGLPARLRRLVRRRHAARGDRVGAPRARPPAPGGRRALRERRAARSTRCAPRAARDRSAWVNELRAAENEKRAAEQEDLTDDRSPLHPMRVYGELGQVLERDAVVIGDGGDFVSFAGRMIDTYEPGCWMDPGPYGCLGAGPARRSRRSSRIRTGRCACCSATARSASRGWSSTPSSATACPSSA